MSLDESRTPVLAGPSAEPTKFQAMADESLKGLLEKLRWAEGSNPTPLDPRYGDVDGVWAVKWVQGAVAAGATRAIANLRRGALEIDLFGDFPANAKMLAQQLASGRAPASPAERHWIVALHHLRARKLKFHLMTRKGKRKQIATVHEDGDMEVNEEPYEGGSGTLSVTVEPAKGGRFSKAGWDSEVAALRASFKYCTMPVALGKTSLSQGSVYQDPGVLMSWMEPAMGDEPFFAVTGDPKQILAPHLVKPEKDDTSLRRCSMMLALSAGRHGTGLAKVWWVRDGALVGPVRIVGPTGVLRIEIICPGDRPGYLSEWASRDTWSFFPDKMVLTVARRLAGGLDTLIPQLAAKDGFAGHLLRQANALTGFRNLMPVSGRPSVALSGPFHASLKAFSLRNSLEMLPE